MRGHANVVGALLAAGAREGELNPAPGGEGRETALRAAIRGGHAAVVRLLLGAGATVFFEDEELALQVGGRAGGWVAGGLGPAGFFYNLSWQ